MNYYASPKNSDRARRFREAYANATPGQNFMFEGQPYAGPEAPSAPVGLPPDQQVQQYQIPPGGWTGGINPYDLAGQNQVTEVNSRPGDMSGPEYQGKDSDYYPQHFFRDIPGGLGPDSRNMGLMQLPNGDWVPDPSTDPSGQSIPFDHPSIAGTRIPFWEQSADQKAMAFHRVDDPSYPRFGAANQMGVAQIQHNPPSSVTGMYAPGQDTGPPSGLLSEPMVDRDWLTNPTHPKQEAPSLLADNSYTNKSGWEKDKKFNNALRQMMMQWGMNQANDDEF